MASRAEEIAREALAIGGELLTQLTAPPVEAAALESAEGFVAHRESLLSGLQQLLAQEAPEVLRPLLEELTEQQRALEGALGQQIKLLREAMQGSQVMRANLASFRRMVDSGTRSRFLDQKR